VVCNVHWQSDVIEGRFIGASAVSQLQSNAGFLADMALAQTELDAARKQGVPPVRDCAAETEALAEVASEAPWPAGR
jgi:acid phosphatase (class A)